MNRGATVVMGLILILSMGVHAVSLGNDAGSGQDAGNDRDSALPLPGPGTYQGRMADSTDADWYELGYDTVEPRCFENRFWGEAVSEVVVELPDSPTPGVTDTLTDGDADVRLPVAGVDVTKLQLGIVPSLTRLLDPLGGNYSFSIDTLGASDIEDTGDAFTGKDAGDSLADATPAPRGCFGGQVWTPNGNGGDTTDVYSVEVQDDATFLLSVASFGYGDTRVKLIDPNGEVRTDLVTGNLTTFDADISGTWYLEVGPDASSSSTSYENGYLLGLVTDEGPDPDPDPCRPTCFSSS